MRASTEESLTACGPMLIPCSTSPNSIPASTTKRCSDRANRSGALLVTADRDFGELVFRLGRIHAGVVLIRLAGLSPEAKAETVSRVFDTRTDELLSAFSVVSPGRVRIRRPAVES